MPTAQLFPAAAVAPCGLLLDLLVPMEADTHVSTPLQPYGIFQAPRRWRLCTRRGRGSICVRRGRGNGGMRRGRSGARGEDARRRVGDGPPAGTLDDSGLPSRHDRASGTSPHAWGSGGPPQRLVVAVSARAQKGWILTAVFSPIFPLVFRCDKGGSVNSVLTETKPI